MPYEIDGRSTVAQSGRTTYKVSPEPATDVQLAAWRKTADSNALVAFLLLCLALAIVLGLYLGGVTTALLFSPVIVLPGVYLAHAIRAANQAGSGALPTRVGPCPHCGARVALLADGRRYVKCDQCMKTIVARPDGVMAGTGTFMAS